jgi:hypothetical protein
LALERSRRRRLGVLLALLPALALALGPPPARAAAAPRDACFPSGARTLEASKRARVFSVRARGGARPVFACLHATGRRVRLGDRIDCLGQAARDFRLAGRFVGFIAEFCPTPGGSGASLGLVDLRGGRVRLVSGLFAFGGGVTDFVLKANGSAAWIERPEVGAPASTPHLVMKRDADGRAQLASGSDIDSSSLALAGSTVYWTQGGAPRAAILD